MSFQRKPHPRTVGKKVFICCEGDQTERIYFNSIRKSLRLSKDRIKVLFNGSAPISVVQGLISEIEDRTEFNPADGDEAWAVFDGDEHINSDRPGWDRALALAVENGIKIAISNPCFELWFLLHFQEQSANLSRSEARRKLKEHVESYEKNMDLYPRYLKDRTALAVQRAQSLAAVHSRNKNPHYTNPSSAVHGLVTLLLSLEVQD